MKKKALAILLALVAVWSVLPVAFAVGTPTITVSSVSAKSGDTVTLSVKMKNNPGINTFAFGFNYDSNKMTLTEVKAAKALGGQFAYGTKAVWLNSEDTSYNGEIMTLTFKVEKDVPEGKVQVKLTYSPGDISNYNEDDVNFSIEEGAVTVGKTAESDKPSIFERISAFFKRIWNKIKNIFSTGE